jgi:alanine racemase
MMKGTSVIEIKKSAIANNINFIRSIVGEQTKISSVVKANAYGHGFDPFVLVAEECGIDHFSVFSANEARRVFDLVKPSTSIMIMGWMNDNDIEWAIENEIEFYVFEIDKLKKALSCSIAQNKKALIHIEVETGMNRTGFRQRNLERAVKLIRENSENFIVKGLCTHYAGAESVANYLRIHQQINRFQKVHRWIQKQGITPELLHTACSAATISYPKTRMDMVRIGIMQYGYWPSRETFIQYVHKKPYMQDPLQRVIRWKTAIMAVKEVNTGEFISYGTAYLANEPKKIAIIPVGYSVGYSRSLSNLGVVLIKGQRIKVIGLVNMNMLIADVSGIPDVKKNDEVILIGSQGDNTITVASFSEFSNQMNYEILSRLPENIERNLVN